MTFSPPFEPSALDEDSEDAEPEHDVDGSEPEHEPETVAVPVAGLTSRQEPEEIEISTADVPELFELFEAEKELFDVFTGFNPTMDCSTALVIGCIGRVWPAP